MYDGIVAFCFGDYALLALSALYVTGKENNETANVCG
jgi:hypothetical protein